MNPQFLYPSQDFLASCRREEIQNVLCNDRSNLGDDAILFRFAFGSLGKAGFDKPFSNFSAFVLLFAVIFQNVTKQLRIGHVLDRFVKPGELCGGGFTYVWNGESVKPSRERQSSGSLDRVNCFGRVFLAEDTWGVLGAEIQF